MKLNWLSKSNLQLIIISGFLLISFLSLNSWYLRHTSYRQMKEQIIQIINQLDQDITYQNGAWDINALLVDQLIDSFDQGGFDPFLFAQERPTSIDIGYPLIEDNTALVDVNLDFYGTIRSLIEPSI